ncbi:MAG: DUF3726 domain-containing protein [Pseudomonadota bacterium]
MVSRTLSEIAATAKMAARGTGCQWGLAEEAGEAARILEAHGLPGVQALARLFDTPRNCAGCKGSEALCGLVAVARLSDRIHEIDAGEPVAFDAIAAPILLTAPLLMAARASGRSYELRWPGACLVCQAEGLSVLKAPDAWPIIATEIMVRATVTAASTHAASTKSRTLRDDDWRALEVRANATFVPESAVSRSAGAGPSDAIDD